MDPRPCLWSHFSDHLIPVSILEQKVQRAYPREAKFHSLFCRQLALGSRMWFVFGFLPDWGGTLPRSVCKVRPREEGHGSGEHIHLDPWTLHPPWVARAVGSITAEDAGERPFMPPFIVVKCTCHNFHEF